MSVQNLLKYEILGHASITGQAESGALSNYGRPMCNEFYPSLRRKFSSRLKIVVQGAQSSGIGFFSCSKYCSKNVYKGVNRVFFSGGTSILGTGSCVPDQNICEPSESFQRFVMNEVTSKKLVGEETESSKYKKERVGVLLLNLGGPETLDDVQPFLYNLFADPDIIMLPNILAFLQQPLALFISAIRAPKSRDGYAAIGGGSPLRKTTEEQADALSKALDVKKIPAKVYVGMRYWHPFTEEAITKIKRDCITRLVVLPLYPQFSIATSGSSLRLLEKMFREDEYLVRMQHTVIPSWYQREGYVKAMSALIQIELMKFENPNEVVIFFSAHGVPHSYVEEAGDPYKDEMERCVKLIMNELRLGKVNNKHTLAYQSRVGPVEWLKPYTDDTIRELGRKGVKSLLAVPISFVSEHIETLEEIDVEYRELAQESGIANWGRVPALGCDETFISDLADAVMEALPYVGAMAVSNLEARQPLVPMGSVEELLATYDAQRRELPPPVALWRWGWTMSAETWNGRAAMLAVLVLLLIEVTTGQGILHHIGGFPLFH
eukprot:c29351_g1_i2 orf=379-2025(+)